MMSQATVPTALGLYFTPWLLDRSRLVAVGATFAAVLVTAFGPGQGGTGSTTVQMLSLAGIGRGPGASPAPVCRALGRYRLCRLGLRDDRHRQKSSSRAQQLAPAHSQPCAAVVS